MRKILLLLATLLSMAESQTTVKYLSVYTDSIQAFRAGDSLRVLSRARFYRQTRFDSTVDFGQGIKYLNTYNLSFPAQSGTFILNGDTTSKWAPRGTYLFPSDTTAFRTFSNLKYLKNADSTAVRTFSDLKYLKNADSALVRTFSDSLYGRRASNNLWTGSNYFLARPRMASVFIDSLIPWHGSTVSIFDANGVYPVAEFGSLGSESVKLGDVGLNVNGTFLQLDDAAKIASFNSYDEIRLYSLSRTYSLSPDAPGTYDVGQSGSEYNTMWGYQYFAGSPALATGTATFFNDASTYSLSLSAPAASSNKSLFLPDVPTDPATLATIDGAQTFTSATWHGSSIDTQYTNAVSKINIGYGLAGAKNAKDYSIAADTSILMTLGSTQIVPGGKTITGSGWMFQNAFTTFNGANSASSGPRINLNDSGIVGTALPGGGGSQWWIGNGTATNRGIDPYNGRSGVGVFKIVRRGATFGDGGGTALQIDSLGTSIWSIGLSPVTTASYDLGRSNATWDSLYIANIFSTGTFTTTLASGSTGLRLISTGLNAPNLVWRAGFLGSSSTRGVIVGVDSTSTMRLKRIDGTTFETIDSLGNTTAGAYLGTSTTISEITRTTTATTSAATGMRLRATSTGTMAQGFGPFLSFFAKDVSATDNELANIQGILTGGAKNTGRLSFFTSTSGVSGLRMMIDSNYINMQTTTLQKNGTAWMDGSLNLSNLGTISSGAITASGSIRAANGASNYDSTAALRVYRGTVSAGSTIPMIFSALSTTSAEKMYGGVGIVVGANTNGIETGRLWRAVLNKAGTTTTVFEADSLKRFSTGGGLVSATGQFQVQNGLLANATEWYNSRGTQIAKIDSNGSHGGTKYLRDSAAFSGTGQKIAIYIQGATKNDYYVATPGGVAGSGTVYTAPSANDILMVYPKTDSLIIYRPASGTSGLKVYYVRMN